MPFFSIIIPVNNRYMLCKRAIDSVLNQTYTDFELILVDDGSTDNTPELNNDYAGKLIFLKQDNKGVSSARNRGITRATGEYIALLDSDDEWLPDKLAAHKKYISDRPAIGIHQTEDIWIRNGIRVNPRNIHRKKEGDIFLDSLNLCLISPSAAVVHNHLFDKYGMFDESLPACEDYDLWLRITAFEKVGLIKKPYLIRHAGHEDQLSKHFWGMDRFRVYSIIKLLHHNRDKLVPFYQQQAKEIAIDKLGILKNGALKRNNQLFAEKLEDIINLLAHESYSKIDYQILLER